MSTFSKYCIIITLLIIFFQPCVELNAQEADWNDSKKSETDGFANGYRWTALRMGCGIGYGMFRDMGTAPISFEGLLLQPIVGLEFGGIRRWTVTVDAHTSVGVFEDALAPKLNFGSFDIANTVRLRLRRLLCEPIGNATLTWGVGGSCFTDVTVNPSYENAAAGISVFAGPELSLRADYRLAFTRNKSIHAEIGCMPLTALMRPGYAYIDNYTAAQPVLRALFDDYQWHLKPFGGVFSDIGFDIMEMPYSHLSISYHWEYLTTGGKSPWRFDHATHMLTIDFYYTLRHRPVCTTTDSRR